MEWRTSAGRCAVRRRVVALAALPFVACSADDTVTLGRAAPDPLFGDGGRPVDKINSNGDDEDPTLTADLLQIYFTSRRPGGSGNGDIWFATRASRTLPFDIDTLNPAVGEEVNSEYQELSPAISRDGLTLWLASDRPGGLGGLDIWQTERSSRDAPWGPLSNLTNLNSTSDDVPRPPGEGELVMPFASQRDGGQFDIYLARRTSLQAPFGDPQPIPNLRGDSSGTVQGGFLTDDGLMLFFQRDAEGEGDQGDLYLSWRRSLQEPFENENELRLPLVNTAARERDPWVNGDHTRFFFASDRLMGKGFDIFATTLDLPVFE